jgi:hypothetical protein
MAPDVLVSRDLKTLQQELSASRKERAAPPAATAAGTAPPTDVRIAHGVPHWYCAVSCGSRPPTPRQSQAKC